MPEIKTVHYPNNFKDVKSLRDEYCKEKCLLVSLEKFKSPSEAKKLKDYLLGITFAKGGVVFQYKRVMLFSMLTSDDPEDKIKLSGFVWRD